MDFSAPIVLGEGCTISLNAQLLTHHDTGYSPLRQLYPTYSAAVTLEDGVYIGAGAIIFPGVRVGQCAVIGAGSIVRETVPAYTVVAGVPARIIRQLDPPSKAIHE
jgi:acetyltransferase-like isoleucine patch superfamily enzyme